MDPKLGSIKMNLSFLKKLDYIYGSKTGVYKKNLILGYMYGPKIWIHKNKLDFKERLD